MDEFVVHFLNTCASDLSSMNINKVAFDAHLLKYIATVANRQKLMIVDILIYVKTFTYIMKHQYKNI